ncbi:MAG: hypothetical protein MJ103_09725, partial [Saccharofermentans sp.]|nr:hypothetical protein [Saccharofermentans sp.]
EKQNELNLITTKTDENIFHYWIHIGRQEYEAAIDDAQRLNSNSHLYYAYLCYRDYTQNNMSISGEEKVNLLASIDERISSLGEQLNQMQSEEESTETSEEIEEIEETEETAAEEGANDSDAAGETEIIEETEATDAAEEAQEQENLDEEVTDEISDNN